MIYSSLITLISNASVVSRMFIHHSLLCDIPGHFPPISFQFKANSGVVHIQTSWQLTPRMCAKYQPGSCEWMRVSYLQYFRWRIDKVDLLVQIPSQLAWISLMRPVINMPSFIRSQVGSWFNCKWNLQNWPRNGVLIQHKQRSKLNVGEKCLDIFVTLECRLSANLVRICIS